MYPGEVRRFWSQDLVGGEIGGGYRCGKLAGGYDYSFEVAGSRSRLDVALGEEPVFVAHMAGSEGSAFALEKRLSSFYDGEGRLTEASIMITDILYDLHRSGRIELPWREFEKLRIQMLNNTRRMITLSNLNSKGVVTFSQNGKEESEYGLQFDGIYYPIPGTGWGVLVSLDQDRIGFNLGGVDGRRVGYWFKRFLNTEDLPVLGGVGKMRLETLTSLVFQNS